MIDETFIGKKVWVLDGDIYRGLSLNSKEEYTIKNINDSKYPADVVVEKDGKTFLTNEHNIICVPINNDIYKYLVDNGVDCVSDAGQTKEGVFVDIEWGDWKHSHLWCDDLMGYLGYALVSENITEEDGSDAYSAERIYKKK